MIPQKTIEELITKHSILEKDLSSGSIDKKKFAEKSKEYSDLNEIIESAKKYVSFEKEKNSLEKILNDFESQTFQVISINKPTQAISVAPKFIWLNMSIKFELSAFLSIPKKYGTCLITIIIPIPVNIPFITEDGK